MQDLKTALEGLQFSILLKTDTTFIESIKEFISILVIPCLTLFIAYKQYKLDNRVHKLNEKTLNFDLYEKRYTIYEAFRNILLKIPNYKSNLIDKASNFNIISNENLSKLKLIQGESEFLFNNDISSFLKFTLDSILLSNKSSKILSDNLGDIINIEKINKNKKSIDISSSDRDELLNHSNAIDCFLENNSINLDFDTFHKLLKQKCDTTTLTESQAKNFFNKYKNKCRNIDFLESVKKSLISNDIDELGEINFKALEAAHHELENHFINYSINNASSKVYPIYNETAKEIYYFITKYRNYISDDIQLHKYLKSEVTSSTPIDSYIFNDIYNNLLEIIEKSICKEYSSKFKNYLDFTNIKPN